VALDTPFGTTTHALSRLLTTPGLAALLPTLRVGVNVKGSVRWDGREIGEVTELSLA
jgi:hypothetical protein